MLSHIALLYDRPALAALLIVPAAFAAVVLAPVTDHPVHVRRRWARVGVHALFVCYIAAIVAVILWPFPVNTAEVCKPHRIAPSAQLMPFHFLADAVGAWSLGFWRSVVRDLAEAGANALLFVPLGLYLGLVLRWRTGPILAFGVGFSLVLELTQLTGVWGAYACAYRRFDVDDVITNSTGAAVGAAIAFAVHRLQRGTDHEKLPGNW